MEPRPVSSSYVWLVGYSIAAGVFGWLWIAGIFTLSVDAFYVNRWTVPVLFGTGFVAATLTVKDNRLPTLYLWMVHGLSLLICWQFRNGV